ncbi:carbonyl reductase [NADPH] 1-like [Loxodonta africana]|uniref:carbonyl reductase [NADPH] 1-like n=1 Tax=Loxodonta africana TaxID=9785 RepID=UPI0030D19954
MSSCSRVAVVTGANKGIGFAIARELCRQFSGDVVLTARDEARGRAAVQQLQAEGLSPRFHQLDIDDLQSIRALRDFLRREYGGLDVLVNNAGIAFKSKVLGAGVPGAPASEDAAMGEPSFEKGRRERGAGADPTSFHIKAEVTLKTNFFGTRDVCTELLPLIKPQGRVVNVSSLASFQALKSCSSELQEKFRSETITEEELVALMNAFVEDAKNRVDQKEGWPDISYGVSKIGVTVLSRIYARNLSAQRGGDKILLNACCPGWVRTDMAGPRAPKSPEEGAETPVYLALLPSDADGPHGQFVTEKRVERW